MFVTDAAVSQKRYGQSKKRWCSPSIDFLVRVKPTNFPGAGNDPPQK
jgi:hypothetical protein